MNESDLLRLEHRVRVLEDAHVAGLWGLKEKVDDIEKRLSDAEFNQKNLNEVIGRRYEEINRLRAALKPFVEMWEWHRKRSPGLAKHSDNRVEISACIGDLEAAAKAYRGE